MKPINYFKAAGMYTKEILSTVNLTRVQRLTLNSIDIMAILKFISNMRYLPRNKYVIHVTDCIVEASRRM